MGKLKNQLVELIGHQAKQEVARLAGEFARAASEDKESILAHMEYERWLAEACWLCLE
jgi:hypothetical protein